MSVAWLFHTFSSLWIFSLGLLCTSGVRLVEADKKTRGEGFGRGLAGVVD